MFKHILKCIEPLEILSLAHQLPIPSMEWTFKTNNKKSLIIKETDWIYFAHCCSTNSRFNWCITKTSWDNDIMAWKLNYCFWNYTHLWSCGKHYQRISLFKSSLWFLFKQFKKCTFKQRFCLKIISNIFMFIVWQSAVKPVRFIFEWHVYYMEYKTDVGTPNNPRLPKIHKAQHD